MYFEALASGGGSDWYYTILMKAPLGAAITVDDGDEEVEATGAGMDNLIGIPVHNDSSTYTISVKMNGLTAPTSSITTPATSGGISSVVEVPFAKISLTYEDNFRGQALSVSDGTHTASPSPVMPVLGNSLDIYVPYTGDWTLEATDPVSGNQFNSSPNPVPVASLDQTVSAGLYVIPDGKTVLPVNDIATWLLCADIKNVSYTTLGEVLADENTLRRLLTDDNAIDYLKRSTDWIKSENLVQTMTSNTTPVGYECKASSVYSSADDYAAYRAFNNVSSDSWSDNSSPTPCWLQYKFSSPQKIGMARIHYGTSNSSRTLDAFSIQGSNDETNWDDLTPTNLSTRAVNTGYDDFDVDTNGNSYLYYRIYATSRTSYATIYELDLFNIKQGLTDSETAMSYIGAYDYAADTLLDDSDWAEGICDSEYADLIYNINIPTLSASSSDIIKSSNYDSTYTDWKAFDKVSSTWWLPTANATNNYIGYKFENDFILKAVKLQRSNFGSSFEKYAKTFIVQGSNDNFVSDSHDIGSITLPANGGIIEYLYPTTTTKYKAYRVFCNQTIWAVNVEACGVAELQFYGREAGGVQTLLKAADISRPYTTLDELLSDPEALATVISSNAAIDYLVTAKGWIDEFTSNQMAMLFIGGNNYASNTLLADSDWGYAIALSSYKESVLNVFPPKMTSDTTPEGRCFSSSNYSGYAAWWAFGTGTQNCWSPANGNAQYVGYVFPTPRVITYATFTWDVLSRVSGGITIEASLDTTNGNDGTWVTLASFNPTKLSDAYPLNNNTAYKGYRVKITGTSIAVYYNGDHHFYGREDVTEGVHIFSAASDTIYDQNNQVIATTDTSGYALVSKSNLPNGTYTLRSTVAKDPDNLSNDFTKVVKVTDDTKAIFLMPDNTLYWYGLKGSEFEECTAANGWSPSPQGFGALAYGTNGITVNNGGGTTSAGISSNKKKNNIIARTIGQGVILNNGSAGGINMKSSKSLADGGNSGEYGSISSQNVMSVSTRVSIEAHVCFASGYNRKAIVNALWYDEHNSLANFFSAANDLIYYISGGVHVPVAKTNSLGEAVVDLSDIPSGETLYSSVAKDPDNLGNPYTKVFNPVNGKFYMMPDGEVLYWYGYKGRKFVNGTICKQSTTTTVTGYIDESNNYVLQSAGTGQGAYFYYAQTISDIINMSNYSDIKALADSVRNSGYKPRIAFTDSPITAVSGYNQSSGIVTTTPVSTDTPITLEQTSAITLYSSSIASVTGNKTIGINVTAHLGTTAKTIIEALWVE